MKNYIKQLEKQNEELQKKLAVAEQTFIWVDVNYPYTENPDAPHSASHEMQIKNHTVILEMRVKESLFGYIAVRNKKSKTEYNYTAICYRGDKVNQRESIDGCKQWVEDWFTSMFMNLKNFYPTLTINE